MIETIMKLTVCLTLLSLASCAAVSSQAPPQNPVKIREDRVSLYLGQRDLDEDEWSPVDEQPMLGLEYVHERMDSAVGLEVGLMGSSDDDSVFGQDVTVSTGELYVGVHKSFGEDVVRPYFGGGISLIHLEADVSGGGNDDDNSGALYAHGGLAFWVSDSVSLGIDLRFLFGSDITIAGVDTNANYGQLAFMLGFGF